MNKSDLSINTLTGEAVDRMIANAARLRVAVSKGEAGETIIDAGQNARGGIEAGLAIAEICLGGMGTVGLAPTGANPKWPFELCVRSTDPGDRLSCQPICGLGAFAWRGEIGLFRARLRSRPGARAQGAFVFGIGVSGSRDARDSRA